VAIADVVAASIEIAVVVDAFVAKAASIAAVHGGPAAIGAGQGWGSKGQQDRASQQDTLVHCTISPEFSYRYASHFGGIMRFAGGPQDRGYLQPTADRGQVRVSPREIENPDVSLPPAATSRLNIVLRLSRGS